MLSFLIMTGLASPQSGMFAHRSLANMNITMPNMETMPTNQFTSIAQDIPQVSSLLIVSPYEGLNASHLTPFPDTYVCVNYEANTQGAYLGPFTCPLPFEPKTFTMCCGDHFSEYCCEPWGNR